MTVAAVGVLRGPGPARCSGRVPYGMPPFTAGPPLAIGGAVDRPPGALGAGARRRRRWLLLYLFFERTLVGTAMRAAAANATASRLVGIRPATLSLLAFGLSGLLAGIAGVAVVPDRAGLLRDGPDAGPQGVRRGRARRDQLGARCGGRGAAARRAGVGRAGLVSSGFKDGFAFAVLLVVLLARPARPAGRAGAEGG